MVSVVKPMTPDERVTVFVNEWDLMPGRTNRIYGLYGAKSKPVAILTTDDLRALVEENRAMRSRLVRLTRERVKT